MKERKGEWWRIFALGGLASALFLLLLFPFAYFYELDSAFFVLLTVFHLLAQGILCLAALAFLFSLARRQGPLSALCVFFSLLFLLVGVLGASVPITSRDALVHHLAVPQWWLEAGGIIEIPWHEWSYYPMLLNLAYTGMLQLQLEWLTPYYHMSFLLLIAALAASSLFSLLKDKTLSIFLFFLSLSTPAFLRFSTEPIVDLGLSFFIGIGVVLLLHWDQFKKPWAFPLAFGLSLGFAMSTKYNGILAAGFLGLAALLLLAHQGTPSRQIFRSLLLSLATALVVFSPWALKNATWTGNPLYPLAKSVFQDKPEERKAVVRNKTPSLNTLEYRAAVYKESLGEILSLPLRIFFQGEDHNPKYFDGVLSPLLLLFLLPLFLERRNRNWTLALIVFGYSAVALLTRVARVRYLFPVLLPTLLLTGLGLHALNQRLGKKWQVALLSCSLAIQLFIAVPAVWQFLDRTDALSYWKSGEEKQDYLRDHLPSYEMIQIVNTSIDPKGSKLYLLLTGNWFYYYQGAVQGSYQSERIFTRVLQEGQGPQALMSTLREQEISHILMHGPNTQTSLESVLNLEQRRAWNEFVGNNLELLAQRPPYFLYAIKSPSPSKDSIP